MKRRALFTLLLVAFSTILFAQNDQGDNKYSSTARIEGSSGLPGALLMDDPGKTGGLVFADSLYIDSNGNLLYGVNADTIVRLSTLNDRIIGNTQTLTLTGSTINLTIPVPADPNDIAIYRDGRRLKFANNDFTISGSTITLAIPGNSSFFEIITYSQ